MSEFPGRFYPCLCEIRVVKQMYEDLTYKINGCLFTVHKELKNIWPEEVYEKALLLELTAQGLKAERQKEFEIYYFDKQVARIGSICWLKVVLLWS